MDHGSLGKDNTSEIKQIDYPISPIERGYNNKTLYIDISNNKILSKPVTDEMKRIFTGGRGFVYGYYGTPLQKKPNGTIQITKYV